MIMLQPWKFDSEKTRCISHRRSHRFPPSFCRREHPKHDQREFSLVQTKDRRTSTMNFESAFKAAVNSCPEGLISLGGNKKPNHTPLLISTRALTGERGKNEAHQRSLRPLTVLKNSTEFSQPRLNARIHPSAPHPRNRIRDARKLTSPIQSFPLAPNPNFTTLPNFPSSPSHTFQRFIRTQ